MRIFITGASGFIGSHLGKRLSTSHTVLGVYFHTAKPPSFPSQKLDLTDHSSLAEALRSFRPDVVVHAAAMSRVLTCQREQVAADEVNVLATQFLATSAAKLRAKLIFISSDQVFSGLRGVYRESDIPGPLNHYGFTKLRGEEAVLEAAGANLIIRSNSVVGPSIGWGESFSDWVLKHLRASKPVSLFEDQFRSPIHIRRMVDVLEEACIRDAVGLVHVGGLRRMSRLDLGYCLARAYGISADSIESASYTSHPDAAIMPQDTSYDISRLLQVFPAVKLQPLDIEFIQDANDQELPK